MAAYGHRAAPTPAEAVDGADYVMMCVGDDSDVRSVALGPDGAIGAMVEGAILIDHTTASADLARELAGECAKRGLGFIDAPVSGGQAGAEKGQLTVMCGCDDAEDFEAAREIMMAYAAECRLLGGVGAGQTTKMVNQICIAGILQGLSEAVNFASAAGLDIDEVVATLSAGAAGSWQMTNRAATMAQRQFDFGFAVEWMRKDLAICLDEADRLGVALPLTAMVDQWYQQVIARGGRRWDTSSLITLLDPPA
ncbi:MAG: oxidoreductase [Ilumatobacter coccineus]|uniref:Oxidoreductase n=1 Tax=Ilumatobacter coccineus TaxID=467094 RepID=A0A2G6KCQ2_9ACTN|nr:MAG: oxidoreductase [Ilumatobacter coccineus]